MQYNNTVAIQQNTYNDFGEEKATKAIAPTIKCRVLHEIKSTSNVDNSIRKKFDLKIIVGNKSFAPYDQLATNNTLTFIFETRKYRLSYIDKIRDFSGKTKFLEIGLIEI